MNQKLKPNGLLIALQSPNLGHERTKLPKQRSLDPSRRQYPTRRGGDSAVHGGGKRWLLQSRLVLLEKVSFRGHMNKSILNQCLICYFWWIEHSNFIQFSDLLIWYRRRIFLQLLFYYDTFQMMFSIKIHPDLFWFLFSQWLSCWELLGMLPFSNKPSLRFVLRQFSSVCGFKGWNLYYTV